MCVCVCVYLFCLQVQIALFDAIMSEEQDAVLPFQCPSTILISGTSGCGKSFLVYQILKHASKMFVNPPSKIIYCYGVYQALFDDMKRNLDNILFFQGLPQKEDLEAWSSTSDHNLIVLDDLMERASRSKDVAELFTIFSHHLNLSVFFIVQNLFSRGSQFRTISLNAHYFIIFESRRDQMQIRTFGRELMPGNLKYFIDAYKRATERRYGYILIDLSPHSEALYRMRTNILPGDVTTVFLP